MPKPCCRPLSARTKSCWPKRRRCHDKNFQTSGQTLGGLPCYYCPAVGAGIRRFDPAGLHQQNCGYRHPTVRHCGRCARSSAGFHPAGAGAADDGRGRRRGGSRLTPQPGGTDNALSSATSLQKKLASPYTVRLLRADADRDTLAEVFSTPDIVLYLASAQAAGEGNAPDAPPRWIPLPPSLRP